MIAVLFKMASKNNSFKGVTIMNAVKKSIETTPMRSDLQAERVLIDLTKLLPNNPFRHYEAFLAVVANTVYYTDGFSVLSYESLSLDFGDDCLYNRHLGTKDTSSYPNIQGILPYDKPINLVLESFPLLLKSLKPTAKHAYLVLGKTFLPRVEFLPHDHVPKKDELNYNLALLLPKVQKMPKGFALKEVLYFKQTSFLQLVFTQKDSTIKILFAPIRG